MPEVTLIIVALPNGLSSDGTHARLSLYLSPRLTGSEHLYDFRDWLSWPDMLHTLRAKPVEVHLRTNSGHAIQVPVDTSNLRPDLWQGIFGPPDGTNTTYVAPYEFDDYTNRLVISYPALDALAVIKDIYQTHSGGVPPDSEALGQLMEAFGREDQKQGTRPDYDRAQDRLTLWHRQQEATSARGSAALQGALGAIGQTGGATLQSMLALDMGEIGLSILGATGDDGIPTVPAVAKPAFMRAVAERVRLFHSMPPVKGFPPLSKDFTRTLDFHKAIAALTSYPSLMGVLGLVLDVEIPLHQLPMSPPGTGQPSDGIFVEKLQLARAWHNEPHFGLPITRFLRMDGFTDAASGITILPQFTAAPRLFGDTPEWIPGDVILGYLPLVPGLFNLAQVDVDGSFLKMLALATNYPAATRSTAVGLPTLRTAGISLLANDRTGQLLRAFQQSKDFNQTMDPTSKTPATLYAQDVVRGYRLDMWDNHTAAWHSLHGRHARFYIGNVDPSASPGYEKVEEGFTQLAVTQPAPDPSRDADPASGDPSLPPSSTDLYLHEHVARWNGWSLSAPRPGRTVSQSADPADPTLDPNETNKAETPFPMRVVYTVNDPDQTYRLPELRFGRRYFMRARAVDLAGNSLPADAAPISLFNAPSTPQGFPYLRYEPVASPALVVRKVPADPGATLEHLIIRTLNTDASLDKTPTTDTIDRHVAPPRTSAHMAEWHGMLDDTAGYLKGDAATFQLVRDKDKGAFPLAALPDFMTPPKSSTVPDNDKIPCDPSAQLTLPYLPDPLARGAALRDLPGAPDQNDGSIVGGKLVYAPIPGVEKRPGSVTHIPFNGNWPESEPFRFQLSDGDQPPAWDATSRVLTVSLPKAGTAEVPLSCYLNADDLPQMGVWQWLREFVQAFYAVELGSNATSAAMAPAMESLATGLGDLVRLALEGGHWMLTPARTLKLIHAVQQPIGHPEFSYLPVDRPETGGPGANGLYTVPLFSFSELTPISAWRGLGAQDAYLLGGLKVHGASTGKVDIEASWVEPADNTQISASAHVDQLPLHSTEDGSLYADASKTRSVGYYVAEQDVIGFINEYGNLAAPRHHFNDTKHRMVRYRAVATTRFRGEFPSATELEREGKKMEFTRPSEEIVVDVPSSARPVAPHVVYVVPTFGWTRETTTNIQTSVRQGRGVRVYLERPWYLSGEDELLGITLFQTAPSDDAERERHKAYVTQWGMDPIWQSPKLAPVPGTDDFPAAVVTAQGLALEETQELKVNVAAHRVGFDDADRQLWYCDILFKEPDTYAPFVRLALARYQQHSLPGVELSHVVLADFAQLTPDRAAAVTSDPYAPRRLGLVVSGRAPDQSNRTEITVTVQRRVAKVTTDLGWEDVPDAVATITHTPATTSVPDTALWLGVIEFAADPQEDEYRLVIREYERLRSDRDEAMSSATAYILASSGGHATSVAGGTAGIGKRLVYAEFFPVHAGHPA